MRCGACGAEVKRGLKVCPQCGATLKRSKLFGRSVRCRSCQARVPSGLSICPYCAAPLRRSWRGVLRGLTLLVAVPVLVYLLMHYEPWAELRALSHHVQIQIPAIAFLATPTFTASPSPTYTLTATGTPTPSRTSTPLPPTDTPTIPPPTATRKPAPTRTPKPPFDAPRLIGPENQAEFHGGDAQIQLTWTPVGALAEDQWYALSLRFTADGIVHYSGTWTKETNWLVPRELYTKAGQSERAFQWDVTVMRQTGIKADGGLEGVALSPPSETRIFFWY
ncbi:MAG: zinc ribbon domain-containing protein [Anaerolineae bacterium]